VEEEIEAEEAARGVKAVKRDRGNAGCKVAECCRVPEGRDCFVCVDRNTDVPGLFRIEGETDRQTHRERERERKWGCVWD